MIIDGHTHRYPETVIADPESFAERTGEAMWLKMVSPENRPSLQGWASRKKMLGDMDEAGIDKCVLLGWYWEKPETCIEANNWHLKWIRQDPDRFLAFLSLRPDLPRIEEYLKEAKENGFAGIGECHPWAQGFSLRDETWLKTMKFACESGWPVNFHVTDPQGRDYPGKTLTPMEDFLWLANEFPTLKIILSHAGALFPLKHPTPENVFYDLSACPLLYPDSVYEKLIEAAGCRKILWGSDYPLRLYPSSQKEPEFASFLSAFRHSIPNRQSDLQAILGENLLALLT